MCENDSGMPSIFLPSHIAIDWNIHKPTTIPRPSARQERLVKLVAPSFDPTDAAAAWTLSPEP